MYTQSVLRYLLYLITALLGELRREARSLCKMCMRARINFTAAPFFLFFPFPAEGGRDEGGRDAYGRGRLRQLEFTS